MRCLQRDPLQNCIYRLEQQKKIFMQVKSKESPAVSILFAKQRLK